MAAPGGVKRTHGEMEAGGVGGAPAAPLAAAAAGLPAVPGGVAPGPALFSPTAPAVPAPIANVTAPSAVPAPLTSPAAVGPSAAAPAAAPRAVLAAAQTPAAAAPMPTYAGVMGQQPPAKKQNIGPTAEQHYVAMQQQQVQMAPHAYQQTQVPLTAQQQAPKAAAPMPTVTVNPPAAAPTSTATSTGAVTTSSNMPKVQDALGYLEKVKNRFVLQPIVYNQFLDIMKDFKSQNIDTEGVIKRVKTLFRGNRSLILGFNQFLPPGYKIELEPERRPTIEFKQAMEYVAKIKNRFREEPYIYAEFLDILHDYQAKRTIDEVYQRVQKLFKGQPDLLDEFKYFLPESAVAPKALTKSGAPAKGAAAGAKPSTGPKAVAGAKPVAGSGKATPGPKPQYDAQGRPYPAKPSVPGKAAPGTSSQKDASRGVQRDSRGNIIPSKDAQAKKPSSSSSSGAAGSGAVSAAAAAPGHVHREKSKHDHREHREHRHHHGASAVHPSRVTYPPGSEKELALFERMKQFSSKAQWVQFLKALNLFANDIVNRGELIRMVEDIYGERSGMGSAGGGDWVERFKQSIGYDEAEEKAVASLNQTNYYAFVSSVDFTICHQVTPSYRELPVQILVPHASGRSALAEEVLNDTCISIPTGSEDFSFKSTRKNIYEENLFKSEDERFELDMLIENNSAAIRVLEPLNDQISTMPPEQAKRVRLPDTIDILHIRAIARVYGEQGYEMVELLNKSPPLAVPIILTRLRQKDVEWRKIRNEMKSTWRKVNEQNYQRSLDHRSFYFKQEDKKRRSPKALVVELKEVHHATFGTGASQSKAVQAPTTRSQAEAKEGAEPVKKVLPSPTQEDLTGEESLMLRAIKQGQPPTRLLNYCMLFKYGDVDVHRQLFDIVAKVAGIALSSDIDQLKVLLFFQGFVSHFFGVDLTAAQQQRINTLQEKAAAEEERRRNGVWTAEDSNGPDGSPTDKEKAATDALGGNMELASDDEAAVKEEAKDEPEAAPAAAAAAAPGEVRKVKAKKKSTKAKKAQKKKPPPALVAKQMGLHVAAAAAKDDDEDEDLDDDLDEQKNQRGYGKKGDDEGEDGQNDGSQARSRAAIAASQLATVQNLMRKLEAAAEIKDGVTPAAIKPVQLHLDSAWLADEQAREKDGSAAAGSPAAAPAAAAAASSSSGAAAAASGAKPSPLPTMKKHGRPSQLFLGSHSYYVFFRLHAFLYERLHTAKQLAHKARRNSSKKKLPATAEERHARFCVILDQLLESAIETSRFEDECRNLLGASSYVLFTVDKLIQQLVKQTAQLLAADNSLKVLSLYQYEYRRVRTCLAASRRNNLPAPALPSEQLSLLARQYLSNIANLLGDDSACAIEYFEDTSELAIGLIENLDESNKHMAGEEWNQFVSEYLSESPVVSFRLPYRRRNVRLASRALVRLMVAAAPAKDKARVAKEAAENPEQLLQFATSNVYQLNGLLSKMDLRSFKLHFIEHTSDVLVRGRREQHARNQSSAGTRAAQQKFLSSRFHKWLKTRMGELAPMVEDANAGELLNSMGMGNLAYEGDPYPADDDPDAMASADAQMGANMDGAAADAAESGAEALMAAADADDAEAEADADVDAMEADEQDLD